MSSSSSNGGPARYVIIRFDDGYQDQFVNALPVIEKFNLPASFFAIPDLIQNGTIPNNVSSTYEYMSWPELQWLYNHGYEIVDHGEYETDLDYVSSSQLQFQVVDSRQAFLDHGITYLPDFGLPQGSGVDNNSLLSYIQSAGFLHIWSAYPPPPGIIGYNQLTTVWHPMDFTDNDLNMSQFEAWANQASSTFVVGFEYHLVLADPSLVNANNPYSIRLSTFTEEMAWLSANGFKVILATNLPNYNSTVLITTTSSSSSSSSCPPYYYIVQAGDYLSKIGANLGVSWQAIAQANNIQSPYIIYPGEQLVIPGLCGASNASPSNASFNTSLISLGFVALSLMLPLFRKVNPYKLHSIPNRTSH